MNFSIRVLAEEGNSSTKCEVVIEDLREVTPLFTDLWDITAYKAQWHGALTALVVNAVQRCMLVVDIRPPAISEGIVFWALFKEGSDIFVQQRFSRDRDTSRVLSPSRIERQIAPRVQGTAEEHARVSEWNISLDDVRRFVEER